MKKSSVQILTLGLALFCCSSVYASSAEVASWPANILYNAEDTIFFVDKAQREVRVYEPGDVPKLAITKMADIGKNQGDKQRENDHRTPEGLYFLQTKIAPPQIPFDLYGSRAFTSDYPNHFDRFQGKTGYGIWLHAVPDTVPLTRGSRGCVVVNNEAIQTLENYVQLGRSPMVIVPEAEYKTSTQMKSKQQELIAAIDTWRKEWEAQNLDSYLEFYHEEFRGSGMNKRAWSRHKKNIKNQYTNIRIELEPLLVLRFGDQILARFRQRYQSDQYEDFGKKTIYAFYDENKKLQILREDWQRLNETSLTSAAESSKASLAQ